MFAKPSKLALWRKQAHKMGGQGREESADDYGEIVPLLYPIKVLAATY
jgi:hypothetical protein